MEFESSGEKTAWSNYTMTEAVVAFATIIILTILTLIFCIKPYQGHKVATGSHYHHAANLPKQFANAAQATPQKQFTEKLVMVRKGDTLTSIFNRFGISNKTVSELLQLGDSVSALQNLTPYHHLKLRFSHHRFIGLAYHASPGKWLVVSSHNKGYKVHVEKQKLESRVHFTNGEIAQSLYEAGHKAGLSDYLIYQLTNSFAWDIDFAKDLRTGDHFEVIYNDYYLGDKKIREGDILAAAFTTQGKTYSVVRYTDPKGFSAYYTPTGRSVKKAFIRTPVKYSRISSRFTLGRYHPILHRIRAHRGIDYAASRGTPIRAAGDGKIFKRERQNGYGNVIMIHHGMKYTTVYGHMSRFAKKLHVGSHVKQGQIIGYVGQTGLATGPHLHYEVRILGKYVNPQKVKLPRAAPVPSKYRKDFFATTRAVMAELELYKNATAAALEAHAKA